MGFLAEKHGNFPNIQEWPEIKSGFETQTCRRGGRWVGIAAVEACDFLNFVHSAVLLINETFH